MKIKNITIILCAFLISFPYTQPIISQKFKIDNAKNSIQFYELLFDSLDFLQEKLTNGTFTDEDMHVLGVITEFVFKMKEKLNERKMKEKTISWRLRPGR